MKTLYVALGTLFVCASLSTVGLAQRSRMSNFDVITTYRIGTQGLGLTQVNQALQQAGYSPLSTQIPVFSVASQFSRPNQSLAFHSELGLSFGSGSSVTNGTYKAKAGFWYARLGASYGVIKTDKFQLAPQLGLVALPYYMTVSPINNATPSLNTVLANPGSAQTATLRTSSLAFDAGLTANLRIPYGSPRQYDCTTMERSFVIGLDAGYRFAANRPLDGTRERSVDNPVVQLSGWYAGLHVGFGKRVRSTATTPVTF